MLNAPSLASTVNLAFAANSSLPGPPLSVAAVAVTRSAGIFSAAPLSTIQIAATHFLRLHSSWMSAGLAAAIPLPGPWVSWIGWVATAAFGVSYFAKTPKALRIVQACAALLWIAYGFIIHAMPVVVANAIVAGAALYSSLAPSKVTAQQ
jgi:hypothetical protein